MYEQALNSGLLKEQDRAPNVQGFEYYIDAFNELSTCRPASFGGLSPIPFMAIVEYSKVYEVEDFHEFLYLIRVMDEGVLKFENNKPAPKPSKKGKK